MHDLRFAFRTLRGSPGFTLAVMATLGLGVGLNTAIFSVVDAVLLKPLPYDEPERVMTLWESNEQLDVPQDQVSAGTYRDWAERSTSFADLGAYGLETYVLRDGDQVSRVAGVRMSPSVLDVLRVAPILGRGFREEEAEAGNDRVVLLSSGFWAQRFGADPDVLGSTLTLDDEPFTIVGVMPEGFAFPPDADDVDLWQPLTIDTRLFDVRAMRVYNVVGRLEDDVSLEQARAEMDAITRGIAEENPESNRGWGADVTPALEQMVGDFTRLVAVLAGAAGLVLLIACVNIANLVLARSSTHQREFAIRATLGAGWTRLLSRSISESLALVVLGGATGLLVGAVGIAVLTNVLPPDLPRVDEVGMNFRVVGFALLASLAAGVLFGLFPAVRMVRPRLAEVLQEGGRGGSGGRMGRRLLNGMVSVQVALALVLLLNAGVMIRSVARLLDVDPGFRTEDVLVAALSLPENEFPDRQSQVQFWNALTERIGNVRDVDAAGAVSALPMSPLGSDFDLPIRIEGREAPSMAEQPRAGYRAVVPGYFETMEIPLVRGRYFNRFDREEGRPVMLLNVTAERMLFPGEDPLGQVLGVPMAGSIEIVGVVADVRHDGLAAPARPELFVAFENFPTRDMHLVLRSAGDRGELADAIRDAVAELAPALPLTRIVEMDELVSESLAQPRFNMALLLAFAVCALLLAAVGIYGVVSYSVVQRTGEIGLRMALGSDATRTFRLVIGQTLVFVGLGGLLGLAGAVATSRVVASLLFGVGALDPVTLAGVSLLLLAIATLAASLPARRATRIDPVDALAD